MDTPHSIDKHVRHSGRIIIVRAAARILSNEEYHVIHLFIIYFVRLVDLFIADSAQPSTVTMASAHSDITDEIEVLQSIYGAAVAVQGACVSVNIAEEGLFLSLIE